MPDQKIENIVQEQVSKTIDASFEAFAAKFMLPFQATINQMNTNINELTSNQSEVKDLLKKQEITNNDLYSKIDALANDFKELKEHQGHAAKVQRRSGSPEPSAGRASSGLLRPPAPSPTPSPTPATSPLLTGRPTALRVAGFKRGCYASTFRKHWEDVVYPLLDANLKNGTTVKFLYLAKFYRIECATADIAASALKKIKDLPIWIDPRSKNEVHVYTSFERPLDQKVAGRFRSHFYNAVKKALEDLDDMNDKVFEMKVVSQTLVVDIDDEPFELVHLPMQPDRSVPIRSLYDNFVEIGITQEKAEKLIEEATTAARAGH